MDVAVRIGDGFDLPGKVGLDNVVSDELGAKPFGLGTHLGHEIWAQNCVGETGEILHLGGLHEGPTGVSTPLEDERMQSGTAAVDRGSVSGWTRSHDDDVTNLAVVGGVGSGRLAGLTGIGQGDPPYQGGGHDGICAHRKLSLQISSRLCRGV